VPYLRERFEDWERFHCLENADDLGFAAGNNTGLAYADKQGASHVMFLDNDTQTPPDCIEKLQHQAAQMGRCDIIGPRVHYFSDREKIQTAGGRIVPWAGLTWHRLARRRNGDTLSGMTPEDYQVGCALMGRVDFLREVGGFDPVYIAYYEDADLCLKARRRGGKILCLQDAVVYHNDSSSSAGSDYKTYRKVIAGWRFFQRWAPTWSRWTILPIAFFVRCQFWMFFHILSGHIPAARGIGKGFVDLIRGRDRDRC